MEYYSSFDTSRRAESIGTTFRSNRRAIAELHREKNPCGVAKPKSTKFWIYIKKINILKFILKIIQKFHSISCRSPPPGICVTAGSASANWWNRRSIIATSPHSISLWPTTPHSIANCWQCRNSAAWKPANFWCEKGDLSLLTITLQGGNQFMTSWYQSTALEPLYRMISKNDGYVDLRKS